jgi:hypothetical protein
MTADLALHLQPAGPMEQHDAGSGLVHVLAAAPARANESLLKILFANAEGVHALGQLGFLVGIYRECFQGYTAP